MGRGKSSSFAPPSPTPAPPPLRFPGGAGLGPCPRCAQPFCRRARRPWPLSPRPLQREIGPGARGGPNRRAGADRGHWPPAPRETERPRDVGVQCRKGHPTALTRTSSQLVAPTAMWEIERAIAWEVAPGRSQSAQLNRVLSVAHARSHARTGPDRTLRTPTIDPRARRFRTGWKSGASQAGVREFGPHQDRTHVRLPTTLHVVNGRLGLKPPDGSVGQAVLPARQ